MRKKGFISLFKERILAKKLESFSADTIPNLVEKQEEMRKWKESLTSGVLQESKETSLDGKFLISVFEKVLGFETNVEGSSKGEWNLIPESTSQPDSSEADATLGFFSKDLQDVRVVIELKGTNIPLDEKQYRSNHLTPVEQAFSYSHKNGTRCHWVIVSNFKEIRLYRSNDSS